MFSRELEVWILRYNLLIIILATIFFFPRCAGISLQSLQVFVSSLDLGVFFSLSIYKDRSLETYKLTTLTA